MPKANIATVKAMAGMYKQKADLEAQLKKVKARIDQATPGVIEYFQRQGTQKVEVDGRTIFLRRELWPGKDAGCTPDELIAALNDSGLEHTQSHGMNVQKMRSVVGEVVGDTQGDPNEIFLEQYPLLRDKVHVSEVFKLGVRKS